MLKLLKKTISICLAAALLLSVMPVVSMAEETVAQVNFANAMTVQNGNVTLMKPMNYASADIRFINAENARITGSYNDTPYPNSDGVLMANVTDLNSGSVWNAYFQADFSGYEHILADPTTKLTFNMYLGGPFSSTTCGSIAFYAIDDKVDIYTNYTPITGTIAEELGLHKVAADQLVAKREDTTAVNYTTYSQTITDEGKQALLNSLKSGTGNSLVTFTAKTVSGDNYFKCYNAKSKITIEYDSDKLDNEEYIKTYMQEVAEDLTWDKLSDEAKDSVTSDINLPTSYRGVNVSWTSSGDAIGADGRIAPAKGENKTVSLQPVFTYRGVTYTPAAIDGIVVLQEQLKTLTFSPTNMIQVSSKDGDKPTEVSFREYYFMSTYMGDIASSRGDCRLFIKYDLSEAKKYIDAANSLKIVITNAAPQGGKAGVVTLLNNGTDNWDNTLSYNQAVNNGMYSDSGIYTVSGVDCSANETAIDDAGLLPAINTAIAQDPNEGKITFRVSAKDYNQCRIKADTRPYIEITYYESDIKADEEFANSLSWSAISGQDIDNVVADLTLPATWYGKTVTYTSTNEGVISPVTGEVTIPQQKTELTLTATVDGGNPIAFNITVPASNLAVKSDRMYKSSGIGAPNYSTGYIYANEAIEGPYTAIIVTYNSNNEVVNINIKDSTEFTIAKGRNVLPSEYYYGADGLTTKVIIVNNMESLTPMAVAR